MSKPPTSPGRGDARRPQHAISSCKHVKHKEVVQSRKRKTPTTSTLPLAEKSPNARPPKCHKNKDNNPDGGGTTGSGLDAVQDKLHPQPAGIGSHALLPDELIDPRLREFDAATALCDTGVDESSFDSYQLTLYLFYLLGFGL